MLRAKALGHPLMHRDRCVLATSTWAAAASSSSPARQHGGKSTYLRTIGINYLLACTGMPVCAEEMGVSRPSSPACAPATRPTTSLLLYELKRLKLIIDKLQSGEELFIILDEILKGTNSMDKQKGSFALSADMALQANGIIATHDLCWAPSSTSSPKISATTASKRMSPVMTDVTSCASPFGSAEHECVLPYEKMEL